MTKKNANLRGVLAAIPTPFTADGSAVDAEALRAQVDRMIAGGLSGIVPTGTTGEFTSLTDAEYREVIRLNVEAAAGRIAVVPGIGHPSTAGAVELAQYAEEVGADAVIFQKYYSFGHEGAAVFSARDVAAPTHPEHEELQAVLRDPAMRSPRVLQTFLSQIASRPTP